VRLTPIKYALDVICALKHNLTMAAWKILETSDFSQWFRALDDDAKEDIYAAALVLAQEGPSLGRPRVDTLQGSQFQNLKELRVQSNGRPFRIAFSFDPKRRAIFLCGGDKTGDKRFYEKLIKRADDLLKAHLKETKNEESKESPSKKR
jgi:hypothetical protein